jgi:chromosome segregation ATPase
LGGVLMWQNREYKDERREHTSKIIQYSNDWNTTSQKLEESRNVNDNLTKKLEETKQQAQSLETALNDEKAAKAKLEADAQKAAQLAEAEVAKRDAKIAELETQVDEQTKQMDKLTADISGLEKKIKDTEAELATTKENREFLLTELKRLQSEKARLEQQFNDLALLRDQVRKLKDELAVARRLEWIRTGVYTTAGAKGGATKLMQGYQQQNTRTNYDLNAEFNLDGTVKINPPSGGTNAPAK